jgi:hypothetical protein
VRKKQNNHARQLAATPVFKMVKNHLRMIRVMALIVAQWSCDGEDATQEVASSRLGEAAEDVTPPSLVSLAFEPAVIDTSAAGQRVLVTARVTDDLSGFETSGVTFFSPSGQTASGTFHADDRVSGDGLDGVYQFQIDVPRFSELGTWRVINILVNDATRNFRNYSAAELAAQGLPTTIEVVGVSDTTPPHLISLSFDPAVIDTSSGPQQITVTARITDDLSGFETSGVTFFSPSGQTISGTFHASNRTSGDGLDGVYQVQIDVPRFSELGTWRVINILAGDATRNFRNYSAAELAAQGFPTTIEVAGVSDTTPPHLVSLSFDPAVIDTSAGAQRITVTARITDDLSGFETSGVTFFSPSDQTISGTFHASNRTSGDGLDGVYQFHIDVPQFSELGTWRVINILAGDATRNFRNYSAAELAAQGFPTSIEIRAARPTLSIRNASRLEGRRGLTDMVFVVSLSNPSPETITVAYTTKNGSGPKGAKAPADYLSRAGTVSFPPGTVTASITIQVKGDGAREPNECFLVVLSAPTNASLAAGQAIGTIVNDD